MNPNDPASNPDSGSGNPPTPESAGSAGSTPTETPDAQPFNPYAPDGRNPFANPGTQSPYPRPAQTDSPLQLSVIGEAINIMTQNWGAVGLAGTIMCIPMLLFAGIGYAIFFAAMFSGGPSSELNLAAILGAQAVMYFAIIIGYGFMGPGAIGAARIALQARRGGRITNSLATSGLRQFGKGVGFALPQYFGVMIGTMLCYVPGFLFGGVTTPGFAILAQDENAGIGDAFTRSVEVMKPQMWMAALLYFILSLLSGLGAIACIVGIVFTVPLIAIGMTLAYCDMRYGVGMSDGAAPFPTE